MRIFTMQASFQKPEGVAAVATWPLVLPSGKHSKKLLKMTIEIVDFPIENGDFPEFFVCLPEGSMGWTNSCN